MLSRCGNDLRSVLRRRPVLMVRAERSSNGVYVIDPSAKTALREPRVGSWSEVSTSRCWLQDPACLSSGSCFLTLNLSSEYSLHQWLWRLFPVYGMVKGDFCYNHTALIFLLSPVNILSFPEMNITQSGITVSFFSPSHLPPITLELFYQF